MTARILPIRPRAVPAQPARFGIKCIPNDEHTAKVLRVRRAMCMGEQITTPSSDPTL